MNILELQEKRNLLKGELNTMLETAKAETRKFTTDEENKMNEVKQQIAGIDNEIRAIEKENEALTKNKKEEKTIRKMGLLKAINDVASNRALDEATQNEIESARAEFRKSGLATKGQIQIRTAISTAAGAGEENVTEEKTAIEVALRNNLVAGKLGANYLSGMIGDISIPKYSGSNVAWADETEAASDGAGAWTELTLTPKRLTCFLDVSKQFLLQDSNDAEAMLVNDLAGAIAEKLDQTIFGTGEGSTKQPTGLLNGVVPATSLDAVAYEDVLALEQAVEEANGNEYVFVCDPKVKFALKNVQKANGLNMVLEGDEIDGQKFISSNSVNAKSIVAIDPKSLVIANWGGLDLTIDPFSQASKGCVRIVINSYFDFGMKSDRIAKEIFS